MNAGAAFHGTDPLTSYGVIYGSAWLIQHPLVVGACIAYYTLTWYETGMGYWEWISGEYNVSAYRNISPGDMGDIVVVSSGVYCGSITNPYVEDGVIAFMGGYCGT